MATRFRYEGVRDDIRQRIESGAYRERQQIPHGTELAAQFGVSIVTVNRALRDLVDLGYLTRTPKKGTLVRERAQWNSSAENRSFLIGAIIYDASGHPLWSIALRGIEDAIQAHECNLLIGNDDGDFSKAIQYVRQFSQRGVDGIAFVPIGAPSQALYDRENSAIVEILESEGIPYVQFHRVAGSPPVCVTLDDYRDARSLVRKMLDGGSQRPICVSHYFSSCSADRELAFVDELKARGVPDADALVIRLHPSETKSQVTGKEQVPELRESMQRIGPFDGVFAVETDTLQVAMEASREIGHNQSKLIWSCVDYSGGSLAGDSVDFALAPPTYELGYMAGESLISHIENRHQIPHRVVMRASEIIIAPWRRATGAP